MNLQTVRAAEPIVVDRLLNVAGRSPVLIRELSEKDRERLLAHFLELDEDDRLLRFGQVTPDHVIENYVRMLDFSRDTVFGVFDRQLQLVGAGHLAYLPAEGDTRTAEFGVSVSESVRGQGIGTTLYIHCLSRNTTMMHIAKKAGMKIEYAYGEADAYLTLTPADQNSIISEMLQEQAAVFDYVLKRQARNTSKLIESFIPTAIAA
jgi:RimJ/RimL family protein N-acetyltransferase